MEQQDKKLHLCPSKFGNVQGSVSTFSDLSVTLGAPRQRGSFLAPEISRLFLVVAMMCDADVCGLIPTTRLKRVFEWGVKQP